MNTVSSYITMPRLFHLSIVTCLLAFLSSLVSAHLIEFSASKKGANRVSIKVSDDGTGINVDLVDPTKIFERGYTSSQNGTGLGLYSVRQILQEMSGSIEQIGDGSRADFEIIIPGERE